MATKCIKFVSGEEVVADVVSETLTSISIKNPLVLIVVGEGQLALMPWLPLAEGSEFVFDTEKVMISYIPKQELVNTYKQRTGGVVMAGAGALNQLPPVPPNFGR
jgi:hypothetical protein